MFNDNSVINLEELPKEEITPEDNVVAENTSTEIEIETPVVESVETEIPVVESVETETPVVESVETETPVVESTETETPES